MANSSGAWSYSTSRRLARTARTACTATAIDAAGNTGVASASLSVNIDSHSAGGPPAIASFSTDSGTVGDHITNDTTLTLTGTAEANSTVKVFDGDAARHRGGQWQRGLELYHRGLGERRPQSHRDGDRCGWQYQRSLGSAERDIDTTAPVAPSIASFSTDTGTVGDGITSDNTLTLTGTAEANATVKVYDGATLLGSATANGSGAWSFTTAALPMVPIALPRRRPMRPAIPARRQRSWRSQLIAPPGVPTITSFST